MKSLIVIFALLGFAAAATLPDSATQGPNPQDIATPEPEYIDIEEPEPAPVPLSAPQTASAMQSFSTAPKLFQHPNQIPHSAPFPKQSQQQISQRLPGHYFGQDGYQYRRPVFIRRVYRYRY